MLPPPASPFHTTLFYGNPFQETKTPTHSSLSTQHCSTETLSLSSVFAVAIPFPHNTVLRKHQTTGQLESQPVTFHTTLFYGNVVLPGAIGSEPSQLSTQHCSTETPEDYRRPWPSTHSFPHNTVLRKPISSTGQSTPSTLAFHTTLFYGNQITGTALTPTPSRPFHTTLFYGNTD